MQGREEEQGSSNTQANQGPSSGGGGGQEGTATAEGQSGLRVSPAAFPVAGQGLGGGLVGQLPTHPGGRPGGKGQGVNKSRPRCPQGSRDTVWVAAIPRSEGKWFPMREPCLAADVLFARAGDYCLVSTYYGPGTWRGRGAVCSRTHLSPNQSEEGAGCLAPRADGETKRLTDFSCPTSNS